VDPVLFRVLFAVLTVFGGAGILLYLVCWLFLPEEGQPTSPAESLIGRGRRSDTAVALLLAVAAFVLACVLVSGGGGDLLLVAVVVVGAVLLARRLNSRPDGVPAVPPETPAAYPAYQPYQPYQPYDPLPPGMTAPVQGATATATYPPGYSFDNPPRALPKRERSALGRITLSVLLLVLGITAALDAADVVDPQPRHYLALALGVVGAGLIVGTVVGRAGSLVWLGIPLTFALVAASTAELSLDGGTGSRDYRPLSVADIQSRYEVGIGHIRLDLSGLDFAERTASTEVSAGIGHVEVLVPREVDVRVVARAPVGEAELFGTTVEGTEAERTVTDQGPDGEGGGRLELVLRAGVGRVEVDRATA
jgi:hypothetical protein